MIKELFANGKKVAVVIDLADIEQGAHPISDPDHPLQLVAMKRNAGYAVAKHGHEKKKKVTESRQKAIVLIQGAMIVVVCDELGNDGDEHMLLPGQCLYLIDGGYSISVKENSSFLEFKNGPHTEDKIQLG